MKLKIQLSWHHFMSADSGSDKISRAEFSSLVNSFKWTTCKLHDGTIQAYKCLCYKEEQNLTPCQIFSFTLTFASHCFCSKNTKRILYIHNGLSLGNLPLCLNVKIKVPFVQDPVHLWVATRRKKLTHTPRGCPFQEIFAKLVTFYFTFSPLPFLSVP